MKRKYLSLPYFQNWPGQPPWWPACWCRSCPQDHHPAPFKELQQAEQSRLCGPERMSAFDRQRTSHPGQAVSQLDTFRGPGVSQHHQRRAHGPPHQVPNHWPLGCHRCVQDFFPILFSAISAHFHHQNMGNGNIFWTSQFCLCSTVLHPIQGRISLPFGQFD